MLLYCSKEVWEEGSWYGVGGGGGHPDMYMYYPKKLCVVEMVWNNLSGVWLKCILIGIFTITAE